MPRKRLLWILLTVSSSIYVGTYAFLYSEKDQQANRFKGPVLPEDYSYSFKQRFEELTWKTADGGFLNGVLFRADSAKGVVCFWKGNGGTVVQWAEYAPFFLDLHYDVLFTDYRQQGKSRGQISLETFYQDAQLVYDTLKQRYSEDRIVVAGFSLGGRLAAHLAASNRPKMTILLDAASTTGDFSDRFFSALYAPFPAVIGFSFQTEEAVQQSQSPVIVIGTDENASSVSTQLKPLLKDKDSFFLVKGARHSTLLKHPQTQQILTSLLQ